MAKARKVLCWHVVEMPPLYTARVVKPPLYTVGVVKRRRLKRFCFYKTKAAACRAAQRLNVSDYPTPGCKR